MRERIAFVFPGQGSQAVGMLTEIAKFHMEVKHYFAEASEILGYDLWQIVEHGPEDKLNQTEITQPAILVASYALWQIWRRMIDISPGYMAGHSLGEISALTCAGTINLAEAVKLVKLRGELMQQAVPKGVGAMAAIIGLSDEEIKEICEKAAEGQVVVPVNYNSLGQVVIGGHAQAVDRAIELSVEAKARLAKRLPMSVPSHCELIKPIAQEFSDYLDGLHLNKPDCKIINNVDVKVETSVSKIKDALVRQLYSPVRFVEIIQNLHDQNIKMIVECGPGRVLTGLIKRIEREIERCNMGDIEEFDKTMGFFTSQEITSHV